MTTPLFTPAQFKAIAALSQGRQPKRVHRNTITSLLNHGWAEKDRGGWLRITTAGRTALSQHLDTDVFLSARMTRSNYTSNPKHAADSDAPVLDPEAQRKLTDEARKRRETQLRRDTEPIRKRIADNITELEGSGDLGREAVKRLANMRRELARLDQDLAA